MSTQPETGDQVLVLLQGVVVDAEASITDVSVRLGENGAWGVTVDVPFDEVIPAHESGFAPDEEVIDRIAGRLREASGLPGMPDTYWVHMAQVAVLSFLVKDSSGV